MKNMKRFSGLIALICVLLSIMLLATACGEAKPQDDEATTENTTASTEASTTEAPTTGGTDDPVTPPDDGEKDPVDPDNGEKDPTDPDNGEEEPTEEPAEELNFFQKIIKAIIDFFKRLFGIKS